ncbi:MAG: PD-(D/E)XK nuclease family protein, partial [Silvibacterium sp.]|nr:PD-(D/E)XK nuclease family protein [Silvibacterium sp.]
MQLPWEIESAFENGATILTANVRAARWLRREYALRQREAGRRVWASPPIEDWDTWVLRLWQAHSMGQPDAPVLLTSLQERSVWTRMQREDAKLLVSPEAMAALAEEAYRLLCDYEAHEERKHAWGQTDAERFRQWAAAFDRECAKQGWVSRARVERLVAENVAGLPLPEHIVMVGFDRITPANRRLLAALEEQGVKVQICARDSAETAPRLVRASDLRDEITACAHWLRGLLDENPLFEANAAMRVGVIVPELRSVRCEIERIFRRVLMPETDDVFASSARMPFEFSLGQPLGEVPVIRAALLLLRWAAEPLNEEQVSWLLLSGYLSQSTELRAQSTSIYRAQGMDSSQRRQERKAFTTEDTESTEETGESKEEGTAGLSTAAAPQPPLGMTAMEEYLALARFDAELRNSGSLSLEISLRNVLREMRRFPALANVQARLEGLQKMAAVNHIHEEERTPGRWVDLAQVLLTDVGWRGADRRNEIDFQARARWERLLDEIALLDFDGRRVSYRDFLETLEMQAGETIFAAESHGAPVQVMGALEASGQGFDAVWFLGADDQAWPARGRMHPLLPNELQKRTGMPHASTEDDWDLARAVTERIASSVLLPTLSQKTRKNGAPGATHSKPKPGFEWGTHNFVVFSHAERNKDGELRPSPLIEQIAPGGRWESSAELLTEIGAGPDRPEPMRLDEIRDASGTIAWPGEECAGGASVLRDQAACPFRAFAAKRLNAEPLNRGDWGLSAMERGALLHEVMERLWSPETGALHTLADLQAAIAEDRLGTVVGKVIGEVFAPLVKEHSSDAWMAAYLASEKRRLAKLLDKWLREHEAKRVPFTVEATEKKLDDVSVGGLKLRLRADRIDVLENEQRLLLDYKTGLNVSTKGWDGDRPDEPQLPLYAIFGNVEDVCGVLFARIR